MKKILTAAAISIALVTGTFSASAHAAGHQPEVENRGQCVRAGITDRGADPSIGDGPWTTTATQSNVANGEPFNTWLNCPVIPGAS